MKFIPRGDIRQIGSKWHLESDKHSPWWWYSSVNCFQNVSLKYRTQRSYPTAGMSCGCELLSECIFEIPDTTMERFTIEVPWL